MILVEKSIVGDVVINSCRNKKHTECKSKNSRISFPCGSKPARAKDKQPKGSCQEDVADPELKGSQVIHVNIDDMMKE
jgi:hypothetical protein